MSFALDMDKAHIEYGELNELLGPKAGDHPAAQFWRGRRPDLTIIIDQVRKRSYAIRHGRLSIPQFTQPLDAPIPAIKLFAGQALAKS